MKTYRVYFNRKAEAPQVWSIDEGSQDTEINVQFVRLFEVTAMSFYAGKEEDPKPSAWFEVTGFAEFTNGGVYISQKESEFNS